MRNGYRSTLPLSRLLFLPALSLAKIEPSGPLPQHVTTAQTEIWDLWKEYKSRVERTLGDSNGGGTFR
jgi:hypothetical protein